MSWPPRALRATSRPVMVLLRTSAPRTSLCGPRTARRRRRRRAPRRAAVGDRDRADDRQAEPAAAAASCRRPRGRSARRSARAAPRERRGRGRRPGTTIVSPPRTLRDDRGAGGRVEQGVLDQVAHQPVQLVGRALGERLAFAGQVERHGVAGRERFGLRGGLAHDGRHVEGHVRGLAPGVGAGEQQQVADQPPHALRRAQRRAGGLGRGGGVARAAVAGRAPPRAARGWPGCSSAGCAARARRRRRTRAGARARPRSRRARRRARAA